MPERLQNYINGEWQNVDVDAHHEVRNPATGEVIGLTPLGGASEVDLAATAAHEAFSAWRKTPAENRVQHLFKLKSLLEDNAEELATIVTRENGKTLSEALGSVRRGIQMVEVACGAPSLLMGQALEDIATGIDCESVRQPMGVFACISPFNFPAMVPMWFFPFAAACGNTFISKPSEQVPFTQKLVWELVHEAGFPPGVLNLVQGGVDTVNALCEHPLIKGISFVGSSPVAEHVYKTAAAKGKRVQALGGAKNFMLIMPDADMDTALDAITESAYGCAGERCLAASIVVPVGACHDEVRNGLIERISQMKVGNGADTGTSMGPVISQGAKERVLGYIEQGVQEGAELVVDGRGHGPDEGYFVGPTLLLAEDIDSAGIVHELEVFGPVQTLIPYSGEASEAVRGVALGCGGLVSSIYSDDKGFVRDMLFGLAPYHGRLHLGHSKVAEHSPGPGTVLPQMVHGGPGRAGSGEELGGLRGLDFYLQRCAVQGLKPLIEKTLA